MMSCCVRPPEIFHLSFLAAEEKEQTQFALSDRSTLWSICEGHPLGNGRAHCLMREEP